MLKRRQADRSSLAISRRDEHLLAVSAMRCNERCNRLRVNARVAQRQGDDRRCPCDLTERICGHSGKLSRRGDAAQSWGNFVGGKARDKDRMRTARPGGFDQP